MFCFVAPNQTSEHNGHVVIICLCNDSRHPSAFSATGIQHQVLQKKINMPSTRVRPIEKFAKATSKCAVEVCPFSKVLGGGF
jgi:hypothetical protein